MPERNSPLRVAMKSFLSKKGKNHICNADDYISNQEANTGLKRDLEELEGSLLLPYKKNSISSAITAVSSSSFHYTESIIEPDVQETKEKDVNKVISLSDAELSMKEKRENRAALQVAKRRGLIKAEQEIEEISRGHRNVQGIKYHSSFRIQDANAKAQKSISDDLRKMMKSERRRKHCPQLLDNSGISISSESQVDYSDGVYNTNYMSIYKFMS